MVGKIPKEMSALKEWLYIAWMYIGAVGGVWFVLYKGSFGKIEILGYLLAIFGVKYGLMCAERRYKRL